MPALAAEIAAWQAALWKTVKVGNYIQASWNSPGGYTESLTRQVPVDPPAAPSSDSPDEPRKHQAGDASPL